MDLLHYAFNALCINDLLHYALMHYALMHYALCISAFTALNTFMDLLHYFYGFTTLKTSHKRN